MAYVFTMFLVTGAALPALPLHIHDRLGFGPFMVGLVSGAQFAASLISRLWSGTVADRQGPKHAVTAGLIIGGLAGLFYLYSLLAIDDPVPSVAILLIGRALLGGAESFIMTSAQSRCLALAGPGNAGKMIAWIGSATIGGAAVSLMLIVPIPAVKPAPHSEKAIARVL